MLPVGRDLDLRVYYKIVQSHGGYDAATSQKLWRKIAIKLGIDTDVITNASYVLKSVPNRSINIALQCQLWWRL